MGDGRNYDWVVSLRVLRRNHRLARPRAGHICRMTCWVVFPAIINEVSRFPVWCDISGKPPATIGES